MRNTRRALRANLIATLVTTLAVAGCASAPEGPAEPQLPALPSFKPLPVAQAPTFGHPVLVDEVRAGGEPVIAVTHQGTILVAAHPGYTHYRPQDATDPPTEILLPSSGESYLWRSTDNGTSWTHVGLPGMEEGPRSQGKGVSDPEFTVMQDGTVCYTDLEALVSASVSCSSDDGLTWTGNPVAAGALVDRQWLASHGDELYFTANYDFTQGEHRLRASTDKGLTWEERSVIPCGGDILADPRSGTLYAGCGNGVTASADQGRTWSEPRLVDGVEDVSGAITPEPAIDSAGNVWVAWSENEHKLVAAGSPDAGQSWPWRIDLTPHFRLWALGNPEPNATAATNNGTFVWPWISAGSEGRFAVTWIGAYPAAASQSYQGRWYIFSAFVVDATQGQPSVAVARLTPEAMHTGPICQMGTLCQVGSLQGEPASDRRLGDFFETTVEPGTGHLLAVWANTQARQGDVISHPEFVRQTGGLSLLADPSWRPTQG